MWWFYDNIRDAYSPVSLNSRTGAAQKGCHPYENPRRDIGRNQAMKKDAN